ncbi:MAG: DEAD/DEAH box helicase, partial [Candidatus Omnitrophica bacterium]|nr:DEAD/DEAH box helicase [Candidatus Omnitrophota bacterium]
MLNFAKRLKNYPSLLERIKESRGKKKSSGPLSLEGLWGSSKSLLISSLFRDLKIPFLIISENVEEAEKFYFDLLAFLNRGKIRLFPFREVLPYEKLNPPAPILEERLKVLEELTLPPTPSPIVIAPIQAILPKIVSPLNLKANRISLAIGGSFNRENLIKKFLNFGYEPAEIVVEGKNSFVLRAGIIDLFPSTFSSPIRIELSGERIASLRLFDVGNQRSLRKIGSCEILPRDELNFKKNKSVSFLEYLPEKSIIFLNEPRKTESEAKKYLGKVPLKRRNFYLSWEELISLVTQKFLLNLYTFPTETKAKKISFLTKSVESIKAPEIFSKSLKGKVKIFFANTGQKERFAQIVFKERKISEKRFELLIGNLSAGFVLPEISLTVLTDHEIFSRYQNRRARPIFKEATTIFAFEDLKKGDYIVHINEGIGRFLGLKRMRIDKNQQEFIAIEYAKGNRLYLPLSHITLIQKYVGSSKPPKLSTLGTKGWLKTKEKIAGRLRDLASDLLELYTYRKRKEGFRFSADTDWQREFENGFIYEETPDQERAIKEAKGDMEKPRPMDRLLCGDVGYGKTEVAMRASFKSVMDSKQAAVLVPTTILATQHLSTFKERFAAYPVNIEMLSRFKNKREQKRILVDLKMGRIDIIIGTHRLLGEDVVFPNLGLLIIDEEQRFG